MEKLCEFPFLCLISTTYIEIPQALHADTLVLFLETVGSNSHGQKLMYSYLGL